MLRAHTTRTTQTVLRTTKSVSDQPELEINFAIDTSGSMAGSSIRSVLRGMRSIFEESLRDRERVSVKIFNSTERTVMGSKMKRHVDWDRIETDIQNAVGGRTALYDAILASIQTMDYRSAVKQRELIIFTDGEDNASETSYERVRQVMRTCKPDTVVRKNLHITLIGAGIESMYERLLENLCEPAHCRYLPCSGASESIVRALAEVQEMVVLRRTTVTTVVLSAPSIGLASALPDMTRLCIDEGKSKANRGTRGRGRGANRGDTTRPTPISTPVRGTRGRGGSRGSTPSSEGRGSTNRGRGTTRGRGSTTRGRGSSSRGRGTSTVRAY